MPFEGVYVARWRQWRLNTPSSCYDNPQIFGRVPSFITMGLSDVGVSTNPSTREDCTERDKESTGEAVGRFLQWWSERLSSLSYVLEMACQCFSDGKVVCTI